MVRENERLIAYARVSTNEQELSLQVDALLAHGVKKEHLYCDKLPGVNKPRNKLTQRTPTSTSQLPRSKFGP